MVKSASRRYPAVTMAMMFLMASAVMLIPSEDISGAGLGTYVGGQNRSTESDPYDGIYCTADQLMPRLHPDNEVFYVQAGGSVEIFTLHFDFNVRVIQCTPEIIVKGQDDVWRGYLTESVVLKIHMYNNHFSVTEIVRIEVPGSGGDPGQPNAPASHTFTIGSIPSNVEVRAGDTVTIRPGSYSHDLLYLIYEDIPWMDMPSSSGGWHITGTALVGVHNVTVGSFSYLDFTMSSYFEITYVREGHADHVVREFSPTVTLYDPSGVAEAHTLRWFTSPTGGSTIGNAGSTVTITASQTMYGREVQTSVILPHSTAHVYVHYRDSFSYVVEAIPPTATIYAGWVASSVDIPINVSGTAVWVDNVALPSGTYEMAITALAPGMLSTQMLLKVHVYPHEVRNLDPYGLSPWSYIVPTYNDLDTMELISATRTSGGVTSPVPPSAITLDRHARMIAHTFTETGLYEFTLRLVSPGGDHTTTILRINVTDSIVSGTPFCDGMDIVLDADGVSADAVLVNPGNFASITWDFGDGDVAMNTDTSARHTYATPDRYTITAHLTNSLGQTVTVSGEVDVIRVMTPDTAYLNAEYVAVVVVSAASADDVTVTCPSWMTWTYVSASGVSYVRITGTFDDVGMVGDDVLITVSSSGVQDASWTVRCDPPLLDIIEPDFEYEVSKLTVRIRYTGTMDSATRIQVQWRAGHGYMPYVPEADGWMYHEYAQGWSYVITVSAIRGNAEYTASKVVVVSVPGDTPGPVNPGPEGPGNGPWTDIQDVPWDWVALMALIAVATLSVMYGRYIPASMMALAGMLVLMHITGVI